VVIAKCVFKGFYWVTCEDLFTTEAQSGSAATENREISRKGAKFGENMVKTVFKEEPQAALAVMIVGARLHPVNIV
jgi:hypothetical protein